VNGAVANKVTITETAAATAGVVSVQGIASLGAT